MLVSAAQLPDGKRYFTRREVAQALGISISLLRAWEQKCGLVKPPKNKHGTRQYTRMHIQRLAHLQVLVQQKRYTLEGAKKALKRRTQQPIHLIQDLQKVRQWLITLQQAGDPEQV